MSDLVRNNIQCLKITDDVFNKLEFLVKRVRVIESKHHLTIVNLGVMVIQHGCFNVTDMKETRWLWWESGNDLSVNGTLKGIFVVCINWISFDFICHIFFSLNY
tara:strand:- start:350 stop:661 length:312 start_codon:yes stop_codon:yes gene_type:complete